MHINGSLINPSEPTRNLKLCLFSCIQRRVCILYMIGLKFIACIINTMRRMPIHTTYDADFSLLTWILTKRHPEFVKFVNRIDLKDVLTDNLVMFQHKYFTLLGILTGFVIPVWVCCFFCDESFITAWNYNCFRYIGVLHFLAMINSFAHTWGNRPFDK